MRYQKENNSLETDFKSIFAEQWEAKEKTISGKVRGFVPVSDFNVLDKKVSDLREELHSHVANVRRRVNQEIGKMSHHFVLLKNDVILTINKVHLHLNNGLRKLETPKKNLMSSQDRPTGPKFYEIFI